MSVSKYKVKKGFKWRFVITRRTIGGKRKDICRGGFSSKTKARLAEEKFRENMKEDTILSYDATLNEVYEFWLDRARKKGVKQHTLDTYENRYTSVFKESLGKKKIDKIDYLTLQEFIDEITPNYVTLDNYLLVIRSIFKLAEDIGITKRNPCKLLTVDKSKLKEREEKKEVLTAKELKNFAKGLNEWLQNRKKMKDERTLMDKALITLLASTGMRISELLALEWNDIDFDKKTISITKTQSKSRGKLIATTPKTKSSIRKIPVSSTQLLNLLLHWKEKQQILRKKFNNTNEDLEGAIFYNLAQDRRFTSQTINIKIEEILKYSRCDRFTSHILRHTFISILRGNGVEKDMVSYYVGHQNKDKNMTDRYTHFSVEYLLDVSKTAEKLIAPLFF